MSTAVHPTCFDASALVKRYIDEPGSPALRQYWNWQATRYTTPFCLYETLGVLKGHVRRGTLTRDKYLRDATDLVAWFRASHSRIKDLDFTAHQVFAKARELVEKHGLDLSDAFQLLSLRDGYFSGLVGESATLLVTADAALALAAGDMGLRVWDCIREPMPQE